MRRKKRRNSNFFRFADKVHSKKGIVGFLLALLSLVLGMYVIYQSFLENGEGVAYLGSIGVGAFLIAMVALCVSIGSLREENTYKLCPCLATVSSLVVWFGWIFIYILGFYA